MSQYGIVNGRKVLDNGATKRWRCPQCRWWQEWEQKVCRCCAAPRDVIATGTAAVDNMSVASAPPATDLERLAMINTVASDLRAQLPKTKTAPSDPAPDKVAASEA